MKTRNLVLVTPDYPPAHGGVARYLSNLVAASNGRIRVIVPEKHPSEGPGEIIRKSFVWRGWPVWFPLIGLFRSIKEEPALISHVFPVGTAAWIAKMMGGTEYFLLMHGLDVRLAARNSRKRWLFRRVCRSARHLFANSKATAKDVEQLTGKQPIILLPGVESPKIPTREEARRQLGLDPHQKIVLSVSRLIPRKGIDMALRVMGRIQKKENVAYVVLGDGDDMERLEGIAVEHRTSVRWIRRANDEEKWQWLSAADVFLLPVRDEGNDVEGFGIAFLEASIAGVPVIAGKSGGASEAVQHERTGLLVSPTQVDEIEEAVRNLLSDPEARKKMGEEGRRRALQDFRWEDRWSTVLKLLETS